MGKLSTIEDVERRHKAGDDVVSSAADYKTPNSDANSESSPQRQHVDKKSVAQAEMEFHGLENQERKSAGHTFLIILAVIVVVAVAVNFANYTLHFF